DSILDLRYYKDYIPKLAERTTKLDLFYEVKANLKKVQIRLLRDAGVRTIQPGIESFSNSILQLMGKGVSALQNIQLLKWCKELGVSVYWNLLWGFPGEDPLEYDRMTGAHSISNPFAAASSSSKDSAGPVQPEF
ncbi:radical SAM protein, partial [bacterium]|nr:radical SAM protein [bacterium]